MPARHAKPNDGAECGTPASSSQPKRRAATAQVPTNNDSELAQDTMDMDDQAIETQVGSAADAEEEFLSPDEVVQGESTSDDDAEEISPREDDEAKTVSGNLQYRCESENVYENKCEQPLMTAELETAARATVATPERLQESEINAGERLQGTDGELRAAPLPRNDIKIIMRPKPGLIVKELKTYEVARAIERASGDPETCKSDKFLLRLRNGSNIIIASTPHKQVAEKILKIKTLDLNGTKHPINTYITTPEGYLKGVIHGLERETPEDELLSNLRVRTQGVTIVQARMLGKSETAVITFDGPIVPRFVYYYGGEMSCVPYRPTRQYCKLCKSQGHRTDVCPTPTAKACSNCRLRDPPEDHTCEPECALCGEAHPTAASECTKKLKWVPQRGRPQLLQRRSRPQTNGILKRRWFSKDCEDSASPDGTRSRSSSRDRSNSRDSDQERVQTKKQQQQKSKKKHNKEAKNKVSWAAIASQPPHQATTQLTRLERELDLMRVRIGDLERENRQLKKQQTQQPQQGPKPAQAGQKGQKLPNLEGDTVITLSILKDTIKEVIPTIIEQVLIQVDRRLDVLDKKIQAQQIEFTKALRKHATGSNIREKAEKVYNRPGLSAMTQATNNA
ncbi:hypothetical protein HPB49_021025 [Dermacentor silvarum]|uniref:Uncharacterized protein n=1 Tax=Dermacentor silvarum TaxID=543639 RepID=A0ACB8C5D0_DERSI|nr:hypothetical protein HPB49_021025 [Dermacentor silvarum]